MSFYREESRKARKEHQCAGCTLLIQPGESYLACSGNGDGDIWHAAYHADCRAFEIKLNRDGRTCIGEWYQLHEIVANEPEALDDAPQQVRARFGLPAIECAGAELVA